MTNPDSAGRMFEYQIIAWAISAAISAVGAAILITHQFQWAQTAYARLDEVRRTLQSVSDDIAEMSYSRGSGTGSGSER